MITGSFTENLEPDRVYSYRIKHLGSELKFRAETEDKQVLGLGRRYVTCHTFSKNDRSKIWSQWWSDKNNELQVTFSRGITMETLPTSEFTVYRFSEHKEMRAKRG